MTNTNMDNMDRDERDIAQLLRAAGPREELPEPLKESWEQRFRDELKPVLHRRQRRQYLGMGLAASIAALGVVALLSWQAPQTVPLTVQVVSASGETRLLSSDNAGQSLLAGQSLSLDEVISTGESAFAAISYQGYDLRMNSDSRLQLTTNGIALQSGEIYVSNEGVDLGGITVITRFGTVEDIGTQFTVSLDDDQAVTTVRRGAIVVTSHTEKFRAEASPRSARQISFDGTQQVEFADRASTGPEWEWIYQGAPGFQLEGRTVAEFLQWSIRETGMRLSYGSKSAEVYAYQEILRGSFDNLNPDKDLETVLAATYLQLAREEDGTLQVSLRQRP
jgi:ferric-dicitrate binding protein FerR (iron transport regulator)